MPTISELKVMIEESNRIDSSSLDKESINIPYLHGKWYSILMDELRILKGIELSFKQLKLERTHYYLGKSPDEVYIEEPLDHRVLKADISLYLDADPKIMALQSKLETQRMKVDMISEHIKQIGQRSFHIKNAIEFMKFKNGVT